MKSKNYFKQKVLESLMYGLEGVKMVSKKHGIESIEDNDFLLRLVTTYLKNGEGIDIYITYKNKRLNIKNFNAPEPGFITLEAKNDNEFYAQVVEETAELLEKRQHMIESYRWFGPVED